MKILHFIVCSLLFCCTNSQPDQPSIQDMFPWLKDEDSQDQKPVSQESIDQSSLPSLNVIYPPISRPQRFGVQQRFDAHQMGLPHPYSFDFSQDSSQLHSQLQTVPRNNSLSTEIVDSLKTAMGIQQQDTKQKDLTRLLQESFNLQHQQNKQQSNDPQGAVGGVSQFVLQQKTDNQYTELHNKTPQVFQKLQIHQERQIVQTVGEHFSIHEVLLGRWNKQHQFWFAAQSSASFVFQQPIPEDKKIQLMRLLDSNLSQLRQKLSEDQTILIQKHLSQMKLNRCSSKVYFVRPLIGKVLFFLGLIYPFLTQNNQLYKKAAIQIIQHLILILQNVFFFMQMCYSTLQKLQYKYFQFFCLQYYLTTIKFILTNCKIIPSKIVITEKTYLGHQLMLNYLSQIDVSLFSSAIQKLIKQFLEQVQRAIKILQQMNIYDIKAIYAALRTGIHVRNAVIDSKVYFTNNRHHLGQQIGELIQYYFAKIQQLFQCVKKNKKSISLNLQRSI